MAALLEIGDLRLRLAARTVLEGVSLRIDAGEIHALVGGNGAGKSSLAYALMGSRGYEPETGELRFDGHSLRGLAMHERARLGITLAWQEPVRFEGLRVRDYLHLGSARADAAGCLRRVLLDPPAYLERMLDDTLSGGERKRIELAAVLAMAPRLAVLDEPTAGVDLLSRDEVLALIDGMKRHGGAVLLITHEERVAALADNASQLCGGRIVCQGPVDRVLESYAGRSCERCDGEACGYA